MIWLTWRQFRPQALVTGCALAVFGVILLITGLGLAHSYATSGLPACTAHGGDCDRLARIFIGANHAGLDEVLFFLGVVLVYGVPALIGIFWGAPLLTREIETGTFRLVWNQSVSRGRWMLVKLGLTGLVAMATAGLLSLMVGWWAEPVLKAASATRGPEGLSSLSRFQPDLFGAHGIVPVGYAAFAFMLGVTAGALIKRTVPAMAVTLAGFAFVQIAWPSWIRPHLMTPVVGKAPLKLADLTELSITNNGQMTVTGAVHDPGAWVLSNQSITPAGHVFTGPAPHACLTGGQQACNAAIGALHLRELITYQPASRFWAFQWYETAIFMVLALALAWFCAWRIGRRRLA